MTGTDIHALLIWFPRLSSSSKQLKFNIAVSKDLFFKTFYFKNVSPFLGTLYFSVPWIDNNTMFMLGNTAYTTAVCYHCKGAFEAEKLFSHQKKCMLRFIKCPDCLEVIVLQKWLDEHECQTERPKGIYILFMLENAIV